MLERINYGAAAGALPAPAPVDSARGTIILGLAVVVVFFAGFGGWAAIAPLDGSVVGDGVVTVEGHNKSVAQVDGGTVTGVLVKDGQQVKAGDVLVRLDDTRARAQADIDRQQLLLAEAHAARLRAEIDNTDFIAFPQVLLMAPESYTGDAMANETVEYLARRNSTAGQQAQLSSKIDDLTAQIAGKQAQIDADKRQLQSVDGEQQGLAKLLSGGLTTKDRSLDLERTTIELNGDMSQAQAAIDSMQKNIIETRQQSEQVESDRRSTVATDLIATEAKILQLRATLDNDNAALQRLTVTAPYSGRVANLQVGFAGAVILPGGAVLDIVPTDLPLIVNSRVRVDDIGPLKVGAVAEVRFPTFQRPDLPLIEGSVIRISADRLTDTRTGAPYYDVEVAVPQQQLAQARGVVLVPGMSASVIIRTEHRTALQYLTGPLMESLSQGFRQP